MKIESLRKTRFGLVLIALALVSLAVSPAAKAQDTQPATLKFTPVPVVVADVCNADFVDTETQAHILVILNLDPVSTGGSGGPGPHIQPPALLVAHTVYFPSGDSVLVDRGMIMQIAVTATTELALDPAEDAVKFPPPAP